MHQQSVNLDYQNSQDEATRELLKQPLYRFDGENSWTIQDAIEGTQIFGATGSGKSSGSGRALATALIHHKIGGVVLAAKTDELDQWMTYFRQEGIPDPIKQNRLRVISPGGEHRFDPLAYEFNLDPEGGTRRLTKLFMTALGTGEGRVASDPYWDDALKELLGHAIDLVYYSHATVSEEGCLEGRQEPPSLVEISDVIKTSAQSVSEARSNKWLSSDDACPRFLRQLNDVYDSIPLIRRQDSRAADIRDTFTYWTRVFPSLADRTRSVVLTSFTGKANDLLRHPLRELFCSTDSGTVTPETTFEGTIILVNLPVKRYGEVGEFAQKLYKTVWQHATESERRQLQPDTPPVFLWADEAQHFVTSEDVLFQATARSKRAATIYLTQNISNYYARLGGAQSSSTDALLGSLQMKIFHANGDPATNEWGERLFGQLEVDSKTDGHNLATGNKDSGMMNLNSSKSKQWRAAFPAGNFSLLERGGPETGRSYGLVFHAGKRWDPAGNGIECYFSQAPNETMTDVETS